MLHRAPCTTCLIDVIRAHPCASPGGISPFTATDAKTHVFAAAGTFTVTLTVRDDDGGDRIAISADVSKYPDTNIVDSRFIESLLINDNLMSYFEIAPHSHRLLRSQFDS